MFPPEAEMASMELYRDRAAVGRRRRDLRNAVPGWIEKRRKFTVKKLRLCVFGPAMRLPDPRFFWRWYNVIQHYAGAGWMQHEKMLELGSSLRSEIRGRRLFRGLALNCEVELSVLRMFIHRCELFKSTEASRVNRLDYESKIETKEAHDRMWVIQDLLEGTCPDCGAETAKGCVHSWPEKVKVKRGPRLGEPQLEVLDA